MKSSREFSHIRKGQPGMVDVGGKAITSRTAHAVSYLRLPSSITDEFDGTDLHSKKGPVFATAIIAGTMAAKNTSSLIPFCHPLMVESIAIDISVTEPGVIAVNAVVETTGKTGVEMEALVGATTAALTIYDMCKAVTKDITLSETKLLSKTGGKHDVAR